MSAPASASRPRPAAAPALESLLAPSARAWRDLRRSPAATLLPVLVLLLPLVPVACGIDWVLREGGNAALQGVLAGAPRDEPRVLIARPDGAGALRLALLVLLVAAGAAVVAAAALVGAGPGARAASGRGPRAAVRRAWSDWPAIALVLVLQAWLLAGLVALLAVVAWGLGQVRFQLQGAVLVVGLVGLLGVAGRLSAWPAVALRRGGGPLAAARGAWRATAEEPVRAVATLLAGVAVVALPAAAASWVMSFVLWRLESAEWLALSPQAIQLWSLLPWLPASVVGLVLWGRAADRLADRCD